MYGLQAAALFKSFMKHPLQYLNRKVRITMMRDNVKNQSTVQLRIESLRIKKRTDWLSEKTIIL